MNVRELKEALQRLPDDALVLVQHDPEGRFDVSGQAIDYLTTHLPSPPIFVIFTDQG